jgi:exodeoxyribonuclease-1
MGFVFYDTETTGTNTRFDQILQFAAIHTDDELKELDRFEIRCRLQPHVIPHPGALAVTGMTIERVTSSELISHYQMITLIRDRLLTWSPSIFVGYNSISFDEELLRSALFQTLHDPYLTNKNGNCRADALTLVRLASVYAPECLEIPCDDRGSAIFKLDQLAPANGFNHANAHDALADVEATIHLARCVKERSPECWSRFVRFASKPAALAFIEDEEVFVLTEFYRNKPHHFAVTPIGRDPGNPSVVYCLDLRHDPAALAALSDQRLASYLHASPKPIRTVKAHKAPPIAARDDCPDHILSNINHPELEDRLAYLHQHPELAGRLMAAIAADAVDYPESEHHEEQIYSGFPSNADQTRMDQFHAAAWEDRPNIVGALEDKRLRHFGWRLLHEYRPELLDDNNRAAMAQHVQARIFAGEEAARKWTTVAAAKAAVAEMMLTADDVRRSILQSYRTHLDAYAF